MRARIRHIRAREGRWTHFEGKSNWTGTCQGSEGSRRHVSETHLSWDRWNAWPHGTAAGSTDRICRGEGAWPEAQAASGKKTNTAPGSWLSGFCLGRSRKDPGNNSGGERKWLITESRPQSLSQLKQVKYLKTTVTAVSQSLLPEVLWLKPSRQRKSKFYIRWAVSTQ